MKINEQEQNALYLALGRAVRKAGANSKSAKRRLKALKSSRFGRYQSPKQNAIPLPQYIVGINNGSEIRNKEYAQ